jgi:CII-binding regulator of phage lambda lysogenization HflD
MEIIGIVLGVIAIGLIFWFKKNQDFNDIFTGGEIGNLQKGYKALMEEFTNYQITNERKIAELEKDMEIRFKSRDRQMDAASKRMDQMNKSLPSVIGQVVGQIEFAQDTINRK